MLQLSSNNVGILIALAIFIVLNPVFWAHEAPYAPIASVYAQSPSATPYVTLFDFQSSGLTTTPFVLLPLSDKTVWVDADKFGPPFSSQIINFTIGAPPKIVLNTTASISSLIADKHGRIWIAAQNLIYYDTFTKKIYNVTAFPGGFPQYMAIDGNDHLWVTLVNSNSIGMYDLSTNQTAAYPVPTANAILQGITVGFDGTIWFAEASTGKLGHLSPKSCTPSSCNIDEYGPPSPMTLRSPVQVATDPSGRVWFTNHGDNEFGWFNPQTGDWRALPIGYCPDNCNVGLPNAIFYSNGYIWFSEHFAGRIARYDPNTGMLTEYNIPGTRYVYAWWAAPGTGNLVWFASFGLGAIGYVNASVPVAMSISSTQASVSIQRGSSRNIPIVVSSGVDESITLGVQGTTQDSYQNAPALISDTSQLSLTRSNNPKTTSVAMSATWTATEGPRYVALTATNGQVSVSVHVKVVIVGYVLPFLVLGTVSIITVGGIVLWIRSKKPKI